MIDGSPGARRARLSGLWGLNNFKCRKLLRCSTVSLRPLLPHEINQIHEEYTGGRIFQKNFFAEFHLRFFPFWSEAKFVKVDKEKNDHQYDYTLLASGNTS